MSVTAAQGFRAAGVTAGLKASGTPDVAVVVNDGPRRAAAAVFTANRVAAADRKSTRLNSSHSGESRMPSSA